VDRDTLHDRVASWVRAGVITSAQADRIIAMEQPAEPPAERTAERPDGGRPAGSRAAAPRAERRARLAEVVGYVGAAFALGAVGLLLAETWSDLLPWARATLAALLTIVALTSGGLVARRSGPALERLAGVLWTSGVAGTAWLAGVVATDVLTLSERWVAWSVGMPAAVVGAALLALGRHVLVQVVTLVALGVTAVAALLIVAPLPPGPTAFGVLVLGGGATWALAGAGGWLGPRISAELTGGTVALIGTQILAASDRPRGVLVVGVLTAALLVAASLPGQRVHLLYLGAAGLFITVPRLVFALFADTLGAPATLLTTGVLLILLATGLGRVRRAQEDQPIPQTAAGQEARHD
jgi:hypothetical protein